MQSALRIQTTVLPGGKIEIDAPEIPSGEAVEVIVLFTEQLSEPRRSALDILAEAPGQQIFQTAEEVDAYIRSERDTWER